MDWDLSRTDCLWRRNMHGGGGILRAFSRPFVRHISHTVRDCSRNHDHCIRHYRNKPVDEMDLGDHCWRRGGRSRAGINSLCARSIDGNHCGIRKPRRGHLRTCRCGCHLHFGSNGPVRRGWAARWAARHNWRQIASAKSKVFEQLCETNRLMGGAKAANCAGVS